MKLQFTNGYRPRFDQISRIMQYLLTREGAKKVTRKEIIAALGIPNKQIENLTSMMTGFGLVLPRVTTLTPFGKVVIQSDPYFDKCETLWIIHYIVSSNPEWVVWYRMINTVIPSQDHYEVEQISSEYFPDLANRFSERTISEKLPKEVGAVFASYTRSDLSRLRILEEGEKKKGFIRSNPIDVPDLAFLYCLLHYRERHYSGSSAVSIEDVSQAENSPGRVFNLEEFKVTPILDNLASADLIRIEKFANLDQIRFLESVTQESTLQTIYGSKDGN